MANAQAGRNLDILELARLTVPIRINQGGHGSTDAKQGLTNLIVNAGGVPFKDTDYSGTLKQDTLTANRTWTLPDATGTLALTSDVDAAGRVLQVVNEVRVTEVDTVSQIPLDDTIPQKTEGSDLLDTTITPKSATSKLLIEVNASCISLSASGNAVLSLFVGSGDDAAGAILMFYGNNSISGRFLVDSPGIISTPIQLRGGPTSSSITLTVNGASGARLLGGVAALAMTITEIAA